MCVKDSSSSLHLMQLACLFLYVHYWSTVSLSPRATWTSSLSPCISTSTPTWDLLLHHLHLQWQGKQKTQKSYLSGACPPQHISPAIFLELGNNMNFINHVRWEYLMQPRNVPGFWLIDKVSYFNLALAIPFGTSTSMASPSGLSLTHQSDPKV